MLNYLLQILLKILKFRIKYPINTYYLWGDILKTDEFKEFVKSKPELIKYVQSGEMTWQKFYELFDLYGTDDNIWNKYVLHEKNDSISKITDIVKNVDLDSIKNHIGTAQKAIDLVSGLTSKDASTVESIIKGPISPRPLNKFFED